MKLRASLRYIEEKTIDLIFPIYCISCGKEGDFLCYECKKTIPLQSIQVCPCCEKAITLHGELCGLCKQTDYPLDMLVLSTDYRHPLIAKMVHLFKYRYIKNLADPLSEIMNVAAKKNLVRVPDAIIPVPLHPKRLRWRGFNQAELLAGHLAKQLTPGLAIPVVTDLLIRKKHTAVQMKQKSFEERMNNVHQAFELSDTSPWRNKLHRAHIVLVDDICTTGATLIECASVLRKLHPKSISAIVVGRQHS